MRRFHINTGLASKPSGCVVCLQFEETKLDLGPFYWFGSSPKERLPDLNEFSIAKHTKGNVEGIKNPRANIRVVPLSKFAPVDNIGELSVKLFGKEVEQHAVNSQIKTPRQIGWTELPFSSLVDANWGHSTEVVYRFCRQCAHPSVMTPSHRQFIGAGSKALNDYDKKSGDRVGWNWRIPATTNDRPVRHVVFDSNFWKSFVQARLAVPTGDQGSLTLFGEASSRHRLFAEHLSAEYRVQTSGRERTVDEWKMRPEQSDNHWLDGLVGCAVGASMQGISLHGEKASGGTTRRVFVLPCRR